MGAVVHECVTVCTFLTQGKTEGESREVGGKIFTFGSYRLGVHGKGMTFKIIILLSGDKKIIKERVAYVNVLDSSPSVV